MKDMCLIILVDPSLPVPKRTKIVGGVLGLVFGFVLMWSGSIYYKKKSAAHVKLCQGKDKQL